MSYDDDIIWNGYAIDAEDPVQNRVDIVLKDSSKIKVKHTDDGYVIIKYGDEVIISFYVGNSWEGIEKVRHKKVGLSFIAWS